MKLLLARFMLAFMLLWLPLQGYAALAMHSCQNHHAHTQLEESVSQGGCHQQHHPDQHPKALVKANLACDDCSSCHLISQPAVTVNSLALTVDNENPPLSSFEVSFLPFFPEQPQRPPLALFS